MEHRVNQRMGLSIARVRAYDRRLSAVHEAGHALMAVYLGYTADAWIHPNATSESLAEKTWVGHMTLHDRPVEREHPHTRMIAVAGMVAETLWKNGHDEEYAEPYGWEDYLFDENSMSYSDWKLANCGPGEPDDDLFDVVAKVAAIFMGELWLVLTDMSRRLMGDGGSVHTFSPVTDRRRVA